MSKPNESALIGKDAIYLADELFEALLEASLPDTHAMLIQADKTLIALKADWKKVAENMQKIILDGSLELFDSANRITLINGLTTIRLSKDSSILNMSNLTFLTLIGKIAHDSNLDLDDEAIPELLAPFIHNSELWSEST